MCGSGPAARRGAWRPPSGSAPAAGCHQSSSRSWSVRGGERGAMTPSQEGGPGFSYLPSPVAHPRRPAPPSQGTSQSMRLQVRPERGQHVDCDSGHLQPGRGRGRGHSQPGPAPSGPASPPPNLQEAGVVALQSGPDLGCQERGQRLRGQSQIRRAQEIRTGRQGGG